MASSASKEKDWFGSKDVAQWLLRMEVFGLYSATWSDPALQELDEDGDAAKPDLSLDLAEANRLNQMACKEFARDSHFLARLFVHHAWLSPFEQMTKVQLQRGSKVGAVKRSVSKIHGTQSDSLDAHAAEEVSECLNELRNLLVSPDVWDMVQEFAEMGASLAKEAFCSISRAGGELTLKVLHGVKGYPLRASSVMLGPQQLASQTSDPDHLKDDVSRMMQGSEPDTVAAKASCIEDITSSHTGAVECQHAQNRRVTKRRVQVKCASLGDVVADVTLAHIATSHSSTVQSLSPVVAARAGFRKPPACSTDLADMPAAKKQRNSPTVAARAGPCKRPAGSTDFADMPAAKKQRSRAGRVVQNV